MKVLSLDIGIKNLAYCLFELETSNVEEKKEVKIIDWDVITIMSETVPKCTVITKGFQCDNIAKYCKENKMFCLKHSKTSSYMKPIPELRPAYIKKQLLKTLYEIADKYNVDYTLPIKKNALVNNIINHTSNLYFDILKEKKASSENLIILGNSLKHKFDDLFSKIEIDLVLIENQISPIANRMKTLQGMITQYFIMRYESIKIKYISPSNKLKDEEKPKVKTTYSERKKSAIEKCLKSIEENGKFLEFKEMFLKHKKKDDLADSFLQGLWYIENNNL